jgi:DNA helicase-2/ATP-dependent DNA helicase PcrA
MDILAGLNKSQREAVESTEGRIRVIAGAGSGKTKALAHRYAYIVNELGIDPANILCLTFTNKAAQEMRSRISKLVNRSDYNDFVCTIHGFCVKFLRQEIYRLGFPKSFSIIDEEDSKSFAKQVMEELGIDKEDVTVKGFLANIRLNKAYTCAFDSTRKIPSYIDSYMLPGFQPTEDNLKDSFIRYLLKQVKFFSLDFEDLIYFTLHILNTYSEARYYWQNQFNYIMVDEVQDCNLSDWSLMNILSEINNNLFIVGDPDQAIYEWRGSRPNEFIDFVSNKDITLNLNYRSTPNILDVANSIIVNNKSRLEKNLITTKPPSEQIIHYHAKSEPDEASWISSQINKLKDNGAHNSDIAVLYRASYLSRVIEQDFLRKGLEYTIWGGVRFFERKEIKDAISYLRLIKKDDDFSFLRISNVPSRRIGKAFIQRLSSIADKENTPLYLTLKNHINESDFNTKEAKEFVELIDHCRDQIENMSISELLSYVLNASGLKSMIRKDEDEERLENITELINAIKYYEELNKEEELSLTNYLQDIALFTNSDHSKDSDKVKLMTIHQAKGLEFSYVFVVGLSEGIFPNMRSIRERKKKGEEERRLMYVAVTRAEKILFLTESEGYNAATGLSKYPSRFLTEIKKNLFITEGEIDSTIWEGTKLTAIYIDKVSNEEDDRSEIFQEGEVVNHGKLGKGVIISYDKNRDSYLVNFEDKGNRNIMSGFLKKETGFSNTTLTSISNEVNISTKRQIYQRYPSVSNSHQSIIKLNVGDFVRHRVSGYGRIIDVKENSWLVHFFNTDDDIEIEKSQVLKFIISSEIDSFYKSNRRLDSYFYIKEIVERNCQNPLFRTCLF